MRKTLIDIYRHHALIIAMASREFTSRHISTLGGFIWSILNPLVTVAIYWFVFSVGFKVQGPSGMPFVLYFLCGLIPWMVANESLLNSISAISGNPHLVKKIAFPTEILPVVQLVASMFTHVILLVLLCVLILVMGHEITYRILMVFYYYAAMCALILGLSWMLSALNVFSRDVAQIVTVMLNLWFWVTPIAWVGDLIPHQYAWALNFNPMYFIVDGYRNAFLYSGPLFDNAVGHLYFWTIAVGCFWIGSNIFHRLKPEFPDML